MGGILDKLIILKWHPSMFWEYVVMINCILNTTDTIFLDPCRPGRFNKCNQMTLEFSKSELIWFSDTFITRPLKYSSRTSFHFPPYFPSHRITNKFLALSSWCLKSRSLKIHDALIFNTFFQKSKVQNIIPKQDQY